jgi:hypothetical protein
MATLLRHDPHFAYDVQTQGWTFDRLVVLFVLSLAGPLLVVYLAAKMIAG